LTPDLDRIRTEYADRARRLAGSNIYSPFNIAHLFAIQNRQRAVLDILRRHGYCTLEGKRILELGCGRGGVLHELLGFGASPELLHGTDLLPDRAASAHRLLPHSAITCADGQHLPYKSESFDLMLQCTVFSSVLDRDVKRNLAKEMLRVLKPDGVILWYDFWLNPINKQTKGIRPSEVRQLFPDCRYEVRRITLAPPLARRLASRSWLVCSMLESLKLFNTHYLIAIRPVTPSSPAS
jgi:ubiquinone/menaquinone biosynthesis C-methylase UbiE